jgi:putative peptidoglycan lipid II flippase
MGIARAAVLVAVITVAARIVGFVRILVFAHTVGPTCLGDTYYTANTVPNILFDVVAGGALTSIVVPVLAGPVEAGDDDGADRIGSALLTWSLLLLLPVTVIGIVAARPVMDLLVGNGHPGCAAAREQTVGARMLVVFMPQVLLYGLGIVLTGLLQAHRRFIAPALAPLISSLVVIGAYLTFAAVATRRETDLSTLPRGHELVLSVGTTLGVVALVLPLLPPLFATGRRLRPALRFPSGVSAVAGRLAVAGAVVLASQDLATAVMLRLANDAGSDGSVVLFNLAWTVFLVPWAVLAVPVATAAFPTLVARWQQGDIDAYAATAARATRTVMLGCAAAAALLAGCAQPLARVVVLGAPGGVPPQELARAFIAFAPGLVGFGLVAELSRVHYARGDARTPATATAAGWALTLVVDIALVALAPRSWTAAALGAGTSVGMTVAALAMLARLRSEVPRSLRGVLRTATAAFAALPAALSAYAVATVLPDGGVASSVAVSLVSAAAGVTVLAVLVWWCDRPTVELLLRRPRAASGTGLG